jgi:hypothetical protein
MQLETTHSNANKIHSQFPHSSREGTKIVSKGVEGVSPRLLQPMK